MATKYKVKTKAVFNGQPPGSTVELDEKQAKKYEAMKYVEIISEVKPKPKRKTSTSKKSTSATKKTTTKKSTAKKEKTEK